ncbi:MAG: hypothetical protein ACK4WF_04280, partial [Candidatus Brocadiales bacterium]
MKRLSNHLLLLIVLILQGCASEQVVEVPFPKGELLNIKRVAILCPNERPDLFMHVAGDDHLLLSFLSPAIVPQLFL